MQPIKSELDIFGLFIESREQRFVVRCGDETPVIGRGYMQIGKVVIPDRFFKKRAFVSKENAELANQRYRAQWIN